MAFCKQCGTQLADGTVFCTSCGAQQEVQQQAQPQYVPQPQPEYVPQPQPQPAKSFGIGKGIAATITGVISFLFSLLASWLANDALAKHEYGHQYSNGYYTYYRREDIETIANGGIAGTILAIPVAILGIIFGALSIKTYVQAKREIGKNQIASLILGIVGIACGVVALIVAFSAFSTANSVLNA